MRVAVTALILLLAVLPKASDSARGQRGASQTLRHRRCDALRSPDEFEECWKAFVADPTALPPLTEFVSRNLAAGAEGGHREAQTAALVRVLDAALQLHRENANLWFARGNVLQSMGRDQEAISSYEQAVGALPVHVDALHSAAALLARDPENKRSSQPSLRDGQPGTPAPLPPRATPRMTNDPPARPLSGARLAVRMLAAVARLQPAAPVLLVYAGVLLSGLRRHRDAAALLRRAARAAPGWPLPEAASADPLERLGHPGAAEAALPPPPPPPSY